MKSVYSIDDLNTRSNQFYIKTEKGGRGQYSGETERERGREGERERGREGECRLREDVASVVKWTIRKYVFNNLRWQHLAGLLLISKMRNLANDVSHDRSV